MARLCRNLFKKPNVAHKMSAITVNLINDLYRNAPDARKMFKIRGSVVCNTAHSAQCHYNYLYTPTNVHKMCKITSYLKT